MPVQTQNGRSIDGDLNWKIDDEAHPVVATRVHGSPLDVPPTPQNCAEKIIGTLNANAVVGSDGPDY